MTLVENLLPLHYIRFVAGLSLAALGALAFFIDGPLAVFGHAARLHGSILRFLAAINERLAAADERCL